MKLQELAGDKTLKVGHIYPAVRVESTVII